MTRAKAPSKLSEAALEHLALLMTHRPDLEVIDVKLYPTRCTLCAEIDVWARAVKWERG